MFTSPKIYITATILGCLVSAITVLTYVIIFEGSISQ
jgi:hypothetical protein